MPTKILFGGTRKFDARPDRIDFRDLLYRARLISLPDRYPSEELIAEYLPKYRSLVLNQDDTGWCTGFGLAAVVNYLRWELALREHLEGPRKKKVFKAPERISARMFYQNARLYDEWKGEDYEGSSCRGAMKGFHKHGVCSEAKWPNFEKDNQPGKPRDGWAESAPHTPLGAYYRIDGKSLVDMQSAIFETHAIYVSADVHDGWDRVKDNCKTLAAAVITPAKDPENVGGHAFAIVGYTSDGFIVQNSWGSKWGYHGFALLPYEDWNHYGTDTWTLALGAPMRVSLVAAKAKGRGKQQASHAAFRSPEMRTEISLDERLRSRAILRARLAKDTSSVSPWIDGEEAKRIIFIGHNGSAERELVAANSGDDAVELVIRDCIGTAEQKGFSHVAIYDHGGLNRRADGIDRARVLGPWFEANGIMPIFVVWQTGFLESAGDILRGALDKITLPSAATQGWIMSKLNEVKDRAFEDFARDAGVKAIWENMKFRAAGASSKSGGLMTAAEKLKAAIDGLSDGKKPQVHLLGHSAGAIMHGNFLSAMKAHGLKASSVHLWAPACTVSFATATYGRAFADNVADPKTTFIDVLSDANEKSDPCVPLLYSKSLLYLVSRALEPEHKTPVLGLQKAWIKWDEGDDTFKPDYIGDLKAWDTASKGVNIDPPVTQTEVPIRSEANKDETIDAAHGSFDNNLNMVNQAIARIIGAEKPKVRVTDLRGF